MSSLPTTDGGGWCDYNGSEGVMDRACGQPGAGAAAQFGVVEAVLTHCGSHDGRGASVVEGEGSHANPQATHHHGAHAPEKTQEC